MHVFNRSELRKKRGTSLAIVQKDTGTRQCKLIDGQNRKLNVFVLVDVLELPADQGRLATFWQADAVEKVRGSRVFALSTGAVTRTAGLLL